MNNLANAQCSIFENKYSTVPFLITLSQALTVPRQLDLISEIRGCTYKSKRQQYLKGQLLAITPSSLQNGGRGERFHDKHSGYLSFDVDGLGNKIDDTLKRITQLPYVSYCGKSASGNGLWGLVPIKYPSYHKYHFDALIQTFNLINIKLDPAPRNVASYRFLAYDPDAYFNDQAEIFSKVVSGKRNFVKPKVQLVLGGQDENVWSCFNHQASFALIHNILLNAGWKYHSTKGEKVRYTRPDKETGNGLSAEYHTTRKTFYVFSSEAPKAHFFINKGGGSPCDIVLQFAANGDKKAAYQILKSLIS
jgi:hypothetical protein